MEKRLANEVTRGEEEEEGEDEEQRWVDRGSLSFYHLTARRRGGPRGRTKDKARRTAESLTDVRGL